MVPAEFEDSKMKNRYFKIEYVNINGGQVFSTTADFYSLTTTGDKLRADGFKVLSCVEIF
jgi:hypothetical protein